MHTCLAQSSVARSMESLWFCRHVLVLIKFGTFVESWCAVFRVLLFFLSPRGFDVFPWGLTTSDDNGHVSFEFSFLFTGGGFLLGARGG